MLACVIEAFKWNVRSLQLSGSNKLVTGGRGPGFEILVIMTGSFYILLFSTS